MSCESRLEKTFEDALILPLDQRSRYILFSDCHRGDGRANDNFLKNEFIYLAALRYYDQYGFTYLELGDCDELWENHSMGIIVTGCCGKTLCAQVSVFIWELFKRLL